jgi:hypothetical protein
MRADIHDGQEHERSIHGPDTEAQDQSPPSLTSGLQHTAGPYRWVIFDRSTMSARCPLSTRSRPNCCITASDVTGQQRPFALQKAASPSRYRAAVQLVTDLHNQKSSPSIQPISLMSADGGQRSVCAGTWREQSPRIFHGSSRHLPVPFRVETDRGDTRRRAKTNDISCVCWCCRSGLN